MKKIKGFKKWARKLFLLVSVLLITIGYAIACDTVAEDVLMEGNDSLVTYIKDDGLYFSFLDRGEEIRIHEGGGFTYPLISKFGDYIAYKKAEDLYVYDLKGKKYEKVGNEVKSSYGAIPYTWIDNDTIVYGENRPGFTVYNLSTGEKEDHLDQYYYDNFKTVDGDALYGIRISEWITEEGSFSFNEGIVEVKLAGYDRENKIFPTKLIIEGRKTTGEILGYRPLIWDIRGDGKYIYIMEKPSSASLSTDGIGLGLYDVEKKDHVEFPDLVSLPYRDNLVIRPGNENLIALIEGGGREMIFNKEIILLAIDEDKTFNTIKFMDEDLLAMTPNFSLDGSKLLYSAAKPLDLGLDFDYNKAFKDWETWPHHIYEYDLNTKEIKKLTAGDNFDFMPVDIFGDAILFVRYKGKGFYSLIKLLDGKEEILADNIIIDWENKGDLFGFYGHSNVEKGMDIFIN